MTASAPLSADSMAPGGGGAGSSRERWGLGVAAGSYFLIGSSLLARESAAAGGGMLGTVAVAGWAVV